MVLASGIEWLCGAVREGEPCLRWVLVRGTALAASGAAQAEAETAKMAIMRVPSFTPARGGPLAGGGLEAGFSTCTGEYYGMGARVWKDTVKR